MKKINKDKLPIGAMYNTSTTSTTTTTTMTVSKVDEKSGSPRVQDAVNNEIVREKGIEIEEKDLDARDVEANLTYAENISILLREYSMSIAQIINECLIIKDEHEEIIVLNNDESLEEVVFRVLSSSILVDDSEIKEKVDLLNVAFDEEKKKEFESDIVGNVLWSYALLCRLHQAKYEKVIVDLPALRRSLNCMNFKNDTNDAVIVLEFINIGFIIQQLKLFNEDYFKIISFSLDMEQSYVSKVLWWKDHVNGNNDLDSSNMGMFCTRILGVYIIDICVNLIYINMAIDCLNLIEKTPKTRSNLNIFINIIEKFFTKVDSNIVSKQALISRNFTSNYLNSEVLIRRFLMELRDNLKKDMAKFDDKKEDDGWTTHSFLKQQGKRGAKSRNRDTRQIKKPASQQLATLVFNKWNGVGEEKANELVNVFRQLLEF